MLNPTAVTIYPESELPQRSAAWREKRQQHVTGTDLRDLCNPDGYRTPYEVWAEKVTGLSMQYVHAGMRRGEAIEGDALAFARKQMVLDLEPCCIGYELDGVPFWWSGDGADLATRDAIETKHVDPKTNGRYIELALAGATVPMLSDQCASALLSGVIERVWPVLHIEGEGFRICPPIALPLIDRRAEMLLVPTAQGFWWHVTRQLPYQEPQPPAVVPLSAADAQGDIDRLLALEGALGAVNGSVKEYEDIKRRLGAIAKVHGKGAYTLGPLEIKVGSGGSRIEYTGRDFQRDLIAAGLDPDRYRGAESLTATVRVRGGQA